MENKVTLQSKKRIQEFVFPMS